MIAIESSTIDKNNIKLYLFDMVERILCSKESHDDQLLAIRTVALIIFEAEYDYCYYSSEIQFVDLDF